MLALAPSETFVYNMAVMGAPVNNTETPTMSWDFSQQTDILLDLLKAKPSAANWTAENTVLTAYFGTNDISMTYLKNAQHPEKTVRIIEAIYKGFGRMYRFGVRQFLAVGMDRECFLAVAGCFPSLDRSIDRLGDHEKITDD